MFSLKVTKRWSSQRLSIILGDSSRKGIAIWNKHAQYKLKIDLQKQYSDVDDKVVMAISMVNTMMMMVIMMSVKRY